MSATAPRVRQRVSSPLIAVDALGEEEIVSDEIEAGPSGRARRCRAGASAWRRCESLAGGAAPRSDGRGRGGAWSRADGHVSRRPLVQLCVVSLEPAPSRSSPNRPSASSTRLKPAGLPRARGRPGADARGRGSARRGCRDAGPSTWGQAVVRSSWPSPWIPYPRRSGGRSAARDFRRQRDGRGRESSPSRRSKRLEGPFAGSLVNSKINPACNVRM